MSRTANQQYLATHNRLRRLWLTAAGNYSRLSATEQWQLDAYFQPVNNLTQQQLLEAPAADHLGSAQPAAAAWSGIGQIGSPE
ncbi:hypothetical protein ACSMXN_21835 [Jatrophihabitans sp. DSM 45814]